MRHHCGNKRNKKEVLKFEGETTRGTKKGNLMLKRAKTPLEKGKTKEGWGEEVDTILIKKLLQRK